jgi:DNA replication licensing factor MCM6
MVDRAKVSSSSYGTHPPPHTQDIVLRHEMVDRAKPGDKCCFTGALVAVPDVAQLRQAGSNAELQREAGARANNAQVSFALT